MQAKEREYKQQLESLKSQAVFNVSSVVAELIQHHAVVSNRRPPPSPRHSQKPPQFKGLVNAFGPSRKRQRTETPPPSAPEPEPGPEPEIQPDLKTEVSRGLTLLTQLLHHLFNYRYESPLRNEPTLFYILRDPDIDPAASADILKVCGDPDLNYESVIQQLAASFATIIDQTNSTLPLSDILHLFSRTAVRHPSLVESMPPGLSTRLYNLTNSFVRKELAGVIADCNEAVCYSGTHLW